MRITRAVGALIATFALFLTACGSEDNAIHSQGGQHGAEDEDPSLTKANNGAGSSEFGASDANGEGAQMTFATKLECDSAFDGPETDLTTYSDVYQDTNYRLEKLVTELGLDYDAFESGAKSVDDFTAELEKFGSSYTEITADAAALGPPEQAEQWHASTTKSWVRVCLALTDAHDGLLHDDQERFAKFEDALIQQPNLLNDLHANTMIGPGENL